MTTTRKRRGRGEGAIFQRQDGLWVTSISLGYDDKGKRRRRTIYGKTKAEVQGKLRHVHATSINGQAADANKISVKDYLVRWLENTAKPSVQMATYVRYEQCIRLRVLPHLGRMLLAKMAPYHIEQFYAVLAKEGASARARHMTGTVLGTALRHAVQLNLIASNPVRDIRKPKSEKTPMTVWDTEQVRVFLKATAGDRLHALYVIAIATGMRAGELFGLQWADIDFRSASIQVQRSLEEVKGRLRLKELKTEKSRRRIDIPRFALDALHKHRAKMLAEGHIEASVFCDTEGNWIRKSNFLRRSFWPLIDSANTLEAEDAARTGRAPVSIPMIRFHDLRHTSATLLLLQGEHPKIVSERLGHASIEITLDTYSHVLPTMQKGASDRLERMLVS